MMNRDITYNNKPQMLLHTKMNRDILQQHIRMNLDILENHIKMNRDILEDQIHWGAGLDILHNFFSSIPTQEQQIIQTKR